MKKFKLMLLITVAVFGLLPIALIAQESPDVLQFYKAREALASPNLKKILAEGRKVIADKKLTFTIANTTVSERDLKTLTGDYKPIPGDDARIKALLAAKASETAEKRKTLKKIPNLTIGTPSYDPRNDNRLPPIRDQQCGDCWAYSAIGALEISDIKENQTSPSSIDLSEKQMVTCSGAGNCSGGMPYKAFEYLQNSRPKMMTAAQYPDNGQDGPCPNFTPETKIELSYWGIADAGAGVSKIADQLKIKQTIIDFGCASTCVDVTPLFQHYSGGVFNENHSDYSHTTINHAVIIVGWDDRKYAWLVRNSWGTGWGEKGYMWIGYDCNNIGYSTTWCVAK